MNVYNFITQPWRYATQQDVTIKTNYPLAREVEIEGAYTALSDATTMSLTLFNILKAPRQRFDVPVLGIDVVTPAMFDGAAPCATLFHSRFGLSAGKLVIIPDFTIDFGNGQTILRCWG